MLNMAAAALYHMFEQQIFFFHRRQVLNISEQDVSNLISWPEFKRRLSDAGINYEALSSWRKINELRIVANAVKHAEGASAEALRTLRPDMFEDPVTRDHSFPVGIGTPDVYMPLAGEDIYVTTEDLDTYKSSLCIFWDEFARVIMEIS